MTTGLDLCKDATDEQLISDVRRMISEENHLLAGLLSRIAEIDERRLYARLGFSSMFVFLTEELHLSEDAAYKRIQVARAARRFPAILPMISRGEMSLTSVNILCPVLTEENHVELLKRAVHRPKREVERLRAELAPQPDVPDMIRSLPQPSTCAGASSRNLPYEMPEAQSADAGEPLLPPPQTPARREATTPLAKDRIKFQFTGSEELRRKIERARELLRHKHPQGRLEDIIGETLDAFLEKRDPAKRIEGRRRRSEGRRQSRPSRKPRTRYIPQHVKDLVWQRDGGRCQYTSPDGRRCGERGFLEFDHIQPFAMGGSSDDPSNLRIFCRVHNALAMRDAFGERPLGRYP